MRAAPELLTARLRLRRWRPGDEVVMARINADPEVTRYLGRPSGQGTAFYAIVTAHWEAHGFGFWAAESREPESAGALLGFIGLGHPTFIPELAARVEIGWRLARRAWGRGLATEGAEAARDYAFAHLRLPELISIIHTENVRSQRVAQKLGMSKAERAVHPVTGVEADVWVIRPTPG
jgi:RimJ/RimL family protein N-acetyltransferase